MIEHVIKRGGGKYSKASYWGRYKLPGMVKVAEVALHCTDKRVAEEKLRKLVVEAEQESVGLIAPRVFRESAARPLTGHLADYTDDLRALNRDAEHVSIVRQRLRKLFLAAGWTVPSDIAADGFVSWRARQTLAPKTLNEYLGYVRAFIGWMTRQGRMSVDALAGVSRVEQRGSERRRRRAFTDDELQRLRGVSGDRWAVYLFVLLTGLRRDEVTQLTWDDIHLGGPRPFVAVRASTTKDHKAATLWLRDDVVTLLPAGSVRVGRVFDVPSMDAFRRDLAAAGIPYVDGGGRVADFHALRKTFGTNLARTGVFPAVTKELMRHSDIKMTMDHYTDIRALPVAAAVEGLPRFVDLAAKVATGTGGEILPQTLSQSGVCSGDMQSRPVVAVLAYASAETPMNTGESRSLSRGDTSGHALGGTAPARTRT